MCVCMCACASVSCGQCAVGAELWWSLRRAFPSATGRKKVRRLSGDEIREKQAGPNTD